MTVRADEHRVADLDRQLPSVTILPLPSITSVSPSPVPTGNFTLTVNGAGFIAGSVVSFDGAALATSFVSSTQAHGDRQRADSQSRRCRSS